MINKEKVLTEIERLKHYGTIPYDRDIFEGICLIETFIKSLPAEPSEELEKFIQDLVEKYPVNKESVPNDNLNDYYQGLRFGVLQGAKWQKEQIMRSAVNGIMDCDDSNEWVEITDRFIITPSIAGKKVKVIIIEDE